MLVIVLGLEDWILGHQSIAPWWFLAGPWSGERVPHPCLSYLLILTPGNLALLWQIIFLVAESSLNGPFFIATLKLLEGIGLQPQGQTSFADLLAGWSCRSCQLSRLGCCEVYEDLLKAGVVDPAKVKKGSDTAPPWYWVGYVDWCFWLNNSPEFKKASVLGCLFRFFFVRVIFSRADAPWGGHKFRGQCRLHCGHGNRPSTQRYLTSFHAGILRYIIILIILYSKLEEIELPFKLSQWCSK